MWQGIKNDCRLWVFALLAVNIIKNVEGFDMVHGGGGGIKTTTRPWRVLKSAIHAKKSSDEQQRGKKANNFSSWAKSVGIEFGGVEVDTCDTGGLGLVGTKNLSGGDLVVQVPSKMALTVKTPDDYNRKVEGVFKNSSGDRKVYRKLPWWAQLSLQLNVLDKIDSFSDKDPNTDLRPWLDSLPRKFSTPIHWTSSAMQDLQYVHLDQAVANQKTQWKQTYDSIIAAAGANDSPLRKISYEDFVWGCECARSRAFSGAYSGAAFNPLPYALTLFLVAVYLAAGLGSIEQAANGAGLVLCGSILNDFVLPKLLKTNKYIICPYIDMANHNSNSPNADVAFEYFADAYSLAISSNRSIPKEKQLFISYGPRSNDQLLQYYGFVEANNPNDIYVMPPIREWNIEAIEKACDTTFSPGRLAKLDKAGLLGQQTKEQSSNDVGNIANDIEPANVAGGVVITKSEGIDPAVLQALRALVSTDEEWEAAGEAIGNFAALVNQSNERRAKLAAKTAMELELSSKPTTLEEDLTMLKTIDTKLASSTMDEEEKLALLFRIEKKKLLKAAITNMG